MEFTDKIRRIWRAPQDVDVVSQAIGALAATEAALTKRVDELLQRHEDLVRNIGIQRMSSDKQFGDMRAILAHQAEETKQQRPTVARTMAEIRRFTQADE